MLHLSTVISIGEFSSPVLLRSDINRGWSGQIEHGELLGTVENCNKGVIMNQIGID